MPNRRFPFIVAFLTALSITSVCFGEEDYRDEWQQNLGKIEQESLERQGSLSQFSEAMYRLRRTCEPLWAAGFGDPIALECISVKREMYHFWGKYELVEIAAECLGQSDKIHYMLKFSIDQAINELEISHMKIESRLSEIQDSTKIILGQQMLENLQTLIDIFEAPRLLGEPLRKEFPPGVMLD